MNTDLDSITTLKIRAILALDKARREYHSFVSVRTLKDVYNSFDLLTIYFRLENNLIKARNKQDNLNKKKEKIKMKKLIVKCEKCGKEIKLDKKHEWGNRTGTVVKYIPFFEDWENKATYYRCIDCHKIEIRRSTLASFKGITKILDDFDKSNEDLDHNKAEELTLKIIDHLEEQGHFDV